MAGLQDTGEFAYPVGPADVGTNPLQAMLEAQERMVKRQESREDSGPGAQPTSPADWAQESKDWQAIEHGEKMIRRCGFTFEPEDGFSKE